MLSVGQLRQLHTAIVQLARGSGRRVTAGIGHQLKALGNDERVLDDAEGFGEVESDFMGIHKTYREHERQLEQQREAVRRRMVQHKYFRDQKLPNMLTYAEKEQMRLLHARNPDEWTAERLAESFPATIFIVQKILDAKWRPRTAQRIRAHDEAVMRNWEEFRTDAEKLHLPDDLKRHLEKFATRRLQDMQLPQEDWSTRMQLPKPKQQEFLSIITSCRKYEDEKQTISLPKQSGFDQAPTPTSNANERPENESYLLDKVVDKRKMRLQELKQFKLTPAELESSSAANIATVSRNNDATVDRKVAETLQNPAGTGVLSMVNSTNYGVVQKYESNEISISTEDQRRFEMTRVKDRIYIPRRLWRKGATYRVEDCYYDDDGDFLYRVPGMTGAVR